MPDEFHTLAALVTWAENDGAWPRMSSDDPAFAPGVGWQEPGGLTTRALLDLLLPLAGRADGLALNEVNPMTDTGAQTTILAANLLFQFVVAAGLEATGP